jgi:Transposase DDE domain
VSYARAGEQLRQVELEIEQLLAKAEAADATPLRDGLTIAGELAGRHERQARLARARAEIEARAYAKAQAERAEKHPDQPGPPPSAPPKPTDQYNFTDPESRIMPSGGQTRFEQAYNAQAAVEVDSRLIVGQRVAQASDDQEQLVPTVRAIPPAVGGVKEVLVDSGFVSEAAIRQLERDEQDQPTGTTVLAAVKRERHGRTVAQLERRADPARPARPSPVARTDGLPHRHRRRAGPLQAPPTDRRAGLRHPQGSARLPAVLASRLGKRVAGVDAGDPRLQLQTTPHARNEAPSGLTPPGGGLRPRTIRAPPKLAEPAVPLIASAPTKSRPNHTARCAATVG